MYMNFWQPCSTTTTDLWQQLVSFLLEFLFCWHVNNICKEVTVTLAADKQKPGVHVGQIMFVVDKKSAVKSHKFLFWFIIWVCVRLLNTHNHDTVNIGLSEWFDLFIMKVFDYQLTIHHVYLIILVQVYLIMLANRTEHCLCISHLLLSFFNNNTTCSLTSLPLSLSFITRKNVKYIYMHMASLCDQPPVFYMYFLQTPLFEEHWWILMLKTPSTLDFVLFPEWYSI